MLAQHRGRARYCARARSQIRWVPVIARISEGGHSVGGGGEADFADIADVIVDEGVRGEEMRGGGMCYVVGARLVEDVGGHGIAEDAPEIVHVEAGFGGDGIECGLFVGAE